jgi:glutathione S-transferase
MAHQESDREDLLREATALVDRAELRVVIEPEPVTVGFRRDGSLSVFFGSDPVYQFNAAGQLRRAFISGLLYKAERGQLIALRRERTSTEVVLHRAELGPAEAAAVLAAARERLRRLQSALDQGTFELTDQVTTADDVISRVRSWLAQLPADMPVAARPNVD